MSTDNEACLAWLHRNCFSEMIQSENMLEEQKLALAEMHDFNISGVFEFFSANQLTRLAHYDVLSGLQKLGVKARETDIALLRERYDADQDGRVGFWEFANIFLPIDPTVRDDLERRP